MDSSDKLSRLSALRPILRASPSPWAAAQSRRNRIADILASECEALRCDTHIAARWRLTHPPPVELGARARVLLGSGTPDVLDDPSRWLFLDTETTGLAGGTGTYAFLVGTARWEDGGFVVEQLFMRDHSEEPALLLDLAERLSLCRVLVTFNGKSFDWPLLETRFRMARIAPVPSPEAHLDLLHPARQLWGLRLKSVALSELERHVLALDRGFDIPSESIPERYFTFLRGGPAEPLADVFRHNRLDLSGLAWLAARMAQLLESEDEPDASESFGISRLLHRRGHREAAAAGYQRALGKGLPQPAEARAHRELALLARRERDFERAARHWEQLVSDSPQGMLAYEQLAIYHERRTRAFDRAFAVTRDALVALRNAYHQRRMTLRDYQAWHARLQHRLDRLNGMRTAEEIAETAKTAKT